MVLTAPHYKLTVDQYDEMIRCCIFPPDAKVELLDGELIEMSSQGNRHARCVRALNGLVHAAGVVPGTVDVQLPMRLSETSEPEPDLSLLNPDREAYRQRKSATQDVLLIIEVAVSSRDYDRSEKVPRYAEAGIPEVWLVDLVEDVVRAYRQPEGGRYLSQSLAYSDEWIAPERLPNLRLEVREILALD